MAHLGVVY